MKDKSGFTTLSNTECQWLFKVYTFYIILSVITHFAILFAASSYYANDRMMGIFKNPNQFGFFIVAYNLFYLIKIRKSPNPNSYTLFIIMTVLIVMTGSRSALLAQLLIHFTDQLINRRWGYIVVVFLFGVVAAIFVSQINTDKVIALISRRDPNSVRTVGDMRMQIFIDTWKQNSTAEMLVGRDASIGTGAFIFEQRQKEESIIWLDSLINVLFYNWGLAGLSLFAFFVMADTSTQFPVVTKKAFIIILYFISSYFFVIGDFFPLPFLLIFLRNNLNEE